MYAMVPTKAQAREKQIKDLAKTKEVKKYLKLVEQRAKEHNNLVGELSAESMSKPDLIIKCRMDYISELMLVKGKEYQRNGDKLHNFRRAAEMQRTNMPHVLHGMLQKHLVSYYDMIDDIDSGKKIADDYIGEKFTDILVYFLLQEVAIKENKESF